MVGGKIYDMTDEGETVLFTVRGTGSEQNDLMDVRGKIPGSAKGLIEVGNNIWWQSGKLYITIFEVGDNEFEKVGYSHNHRHIPMASPEYKPFN